MDKTSVITTRLNAETVAEVDRIAAAQGRSRAGFAAEAIQRTVEAEAEFMVFVQEGIDSADRGELTGQYQVFANLKERRQQRYGL
ncbi:CopG family ribbon-helix-helix protein [Sphingomonas sp. PAMC 26621]|uniref:CopG family ribbon-helix-helix protein n=1 Tax=Sphingomonas sp. PAMC 26621 TaxID=1112213 RepID=UPI000287C964|nr:ribbon-helix-helix protein, CopG family [Sphingomonas sp. PAMC 26621]